MYMYACIGKFYSTTAIKLRKIILVLSFLGVFLKNSGPEYINSIIFRLGGRGGGGAFDARANFELLAISDNLR